MDLFGWKSLQPQWLNSSNGASFTGSFSPSPVHTSQFRHSNLHRSIAKPGANCSLCLHPHTLPFSPWPRVGHICFPSPSKKSSACCISSKFLMFKVLHTILPIFPSVDSHSNSPFKINTFTWWNFKCVHYELSTITQLSIPLFEMSLPYPLLFYLPLCLLRFHWGQCLMLALLQSCTWLIQPSAPSALKVGLLLLLSHMPPLFLDSKLLNRNHTFFFSTYTEVSSTMPFT